MYHNKNRKIKEFFYYKNKIWRKLNQEESHALKRKKKSNQNLKNTQLIIHIRSLAERNLERLNIQREKNCIYMLD